MAKARPIKDADVLYPGDIIVYEDGTRIAVLKLLDYDYSIGQYSEWTYLGKGNDGDYYEYVVSNREGFGDSGKLIRSKLSELIYG